ncbi:uncharacterized protein Z519_06040 [Cladophialophora bantiana CBS 173.52]|uniref:Uncharacterized protein n=1 Tax=Cladophialophora bantiana (strain ATCC 10958 / CBS 173.52 / CDC B-1940 / NIH 8579) TaxID=1442370 RepID=A0A0D2HRH5_CLAB1|nr:uncharacterized protein Z519_06040 [Cladophialophora bantiana CBS 173.52]KIW93435.1 hypothetical protein Z519_06040 [Cladophialophora bantiana CBS 173.52]
MASNGCANYVFVEMKLKGKQASVSRGNQISHALKNHHRAARRERTKLYLAARQSLLARNAHAKRYQALSDSSSPPEESSSSERSSPEQKERQVSEVEILNPKALGMVLGQGRLDPFNIYPHDTISLYVHEILDHAINHTWPGVCPFGYAASHPVRRAWLGCAMDFPVAFYSFVFAAGLHHAYLHGWSRISKTAYNLLFSYKTKAISLVNEALQKVDVEISDALLVSILILAAHGPAATSCDKEPPEYPVSPLANAQDLDFYGSLRFDELHMGALRILVARRGGLKNIQLYGIADMIALGEVYGASSTLTKPEFREWFACPTPLLLLPDCQFSSREIFPSLRNRTVFKQLLSILCAMSTICKALTHLRQGGTNPAFFTNIIRTRNRVQHRLLSLPHQESSSDLDHGIYETCRLAAMIFSDMVIFPLPPATEIRPRLAGMLRKTLESLPVHLERASHTEILLWAAMLGAIAAAKTEKHRTWYHLAVKQYAVLLGAGRWTEMQTVLKRHLWMEEFCDPPAKAVWEEAIGLDPPVHAA